MDWVLLIWLVVPGQMTSVPVKDETSCEYARARIHAEFSEQVQQPGGSPLPIATACFSAKVSKKDLETLLTPRVPRAAQPQAAVPLQQPGQDAHPNYQ